MLILRITYFLLSIFLCASLLGQSAKGITHSNVLNPKNDGSRAPIDIPTIESAKFSLTPQGVYMEVGMYLTFSARDTQFSRDTNLLEYTLEFQLPEGSMITDSWLWIEDDIIQAAIEERWSAQQKYEDIVDRVIIDPSILTKSRIGDLDTYYFKVYPLEPDSTRSVKITYLTPIKWSESIASISFPLDILKQTKHDIPEINFYYFPKDGFTNPRLSDLPQSAFESVDHITLGSAYELSLPYAELQDELNFELDVIMQDGVFISNYEEADKDYYQVALVPEQAFDIESSKRAMIVLDYDTAYTTLQSSELLTKMKEQLTSTLTSDDYFNFVLPFSIGPVFNETWMQASPENIRNVFNLLEEDQRSFTTKSRFSELLFYGIDNMIENDIGGDVLIFSVNEEFNKEAQADILLRKVSDKIVDSNITIHTIHYQDKVVKRITEFAGSEDYLLQGEKYPNRYLYEKLAESTIGTFEYFKDVGDIKPLVSNAINSISSLIDYPVLSVEGENGGCIGKYNLFTDKYKSPLQQVVIVGKCRAGSVIIKLEAETQNGKIIKEINLDQHLISKGNEKTMISYFGNYIRSLEETTHDKEVPTQQLIEEVIEKSIQFRVLSYYTAFLALEEDLGGFVCTQCVDETDVNHDVPDNTVGKFNNSTNDVILTNILFGSQRNGTGIWPLDGEELTTSLDEIDLTPYTVTVSPNPFEHSVEINIETETIISNDDFILLIFDINGRVVKRFQLNEYLLGNNNVNIVWDGKSKNGLELNNGTYFLTLQSKTWRSTIKLVKIN